MKIFIHLWHGAPVSALFRPRTIVGQTPSGVAVLKVQDAAVFTNWLRIRKQILALAAQREVIVDLSAARLVDHTTMKSSGNWYKTGNSPGASFR